MVRPWRDVELAERVGDHVGLGAPDRTDVGGGAGLQGEGVGEPEVLDDADGRVLGFGGRQRQDVAGVGADPSSISAMPG